MQVNGQLLSEFKLTQYRYRITCQHSEIYVAVRTGAPPFACEPNR